MAKFTRYFLLLFLLAFYFNAQAQPYNNEWIDYNKTYYGFKVGPFGYDIVSAPIKSGIAHITQSALVAAGLANVPSEHFQLWRDGAEVPLYISKSSGVLSADDYLEFFGEVANGKTDKELYAEDNYRLSDYWNLFTDSATYYLTVNSTGNNKRIIQSANDLSGSLPEADKNFYYTAGRYYRAAISQGVGLYAEQKLYLSSYDRNEGWVSRPVRKNLSPLGSAQLPQFFNKLHLDTAQQAMTAKLVLAGNAPYERQAKIFLNNDSLVQFEMNDFLQKRIIVNDIPANTIKNDTAVLLIQNLGAEDDDELRVASIELTYPRFFDFDGRNYFEFSLLPSSVGRNIEIRNFDMGNALPILTDKLNSKRYFADTSQRDILRFFLPASPTGYDLVLRKNDLSTVKNIIQLEAKKFVDYSLAGNQGDYLIITNPLLQQGPVDYVKEYSNYRGSDSGGHYKVSVVNVHELVDQFAYGVKMSTAGLKNFLRFANDKFSVKPQYVFLIG
ncbi:MAG: C25 family cysteine peptidase, partial [Dokdonella sp.]|uniref:C25 family cysteine peptidase n=1 Tax=Dokdonella sp. TaxID=2291710 RepID=UPI003BAF07FF